MDSIQVGCRHRKVLGDLTDLCASIQQLGLLQPITISPQGVLLCGARRLAAVKTLGWTAVNVWVRSGISTTMEMLMAEHHENTMRAELTQTEAAALYRELKTVHTEDAGRRQKASRFGGNNESPDSAESPMSSGDDGAAAAAAPCDGDARAQAAEMVTGKKSYSRLEQVSELQALADDAAVPEHLRALARDALTKMDEGASVKDAYARVKVAQAIDMLERLGTEQAAAEAERLKSVGDMPAADLLRLIKQALNNAADPGEQDARPRRNRGPGAFTILWGELRGWSDEYDPEQVGPQLSIEQWATFTSTVDATVEFKERGDQARREQQPV